MNPHRTRFSDRRGSILLVAMLLAAIIGVSLVSYLNLSNNSLKQAQRTFYANSGMNLAEVGLEQAIYCFNTIDNVANVNDAWPSWTLNSTAYNSSSSPYTPYAVKEYTGYDVGPNTTGKVKIYVHYYQGGSGVSPVIVAKSTISQPNAPVIEKYIEVTLRKRALFANGLVARQNVTWMGQPMADSWDSHGDTQTPAVAYSSAVRTANVVVGSISGNIGLAGGEVWGYAKTGEFGSITGGSVHPLGTSTDDPTRRTNDFNATFPNPTTPVPAATNSITSNITSSTTFPRGGDVSTMVAGVQTYYYTFSTSANININGSDNIAVSAGAHVVFIMNNRSGTTAISCTGNSQFSVGLNSTFDVYTDGNVRIAGNGMANANNYAASAKFWGTNTTSQSFDISGNGQLIGIVYAPNGDVSLNGGGTNGLMMGAVVAKSITMNGQTTFHYDDSLGRLTTGNPYGISKWRELQSKTERDSYSTQLAL
ncbi:MAG: hypothetical protein JSR48_09720 [Verrucomicrobia bacterium]|nr:hypothetical protein [Verrucomicrobiota bacterium]